MMDSAKIFIDTDNEITFILEKILSAKSEKVCLVVPDRASLFTSISGLKLIKRVVDKSNKLLVMVTLDENGADLAKKSGLIVVSRVGEITEQLWESAQKSKFEFVKKQKNRVYYQPENQQDLKVEEEKPIEVATEDSRIILQEIVSSDSHSLDNEEVIEEIDNITPEVTEDKADENLEIGEIPQVRIRVDEEEVLNIEEQEKDKTEKIPLEKVKKKKDLENDEENVKKNTLRMRKTAENSQSLSFTFGKDINPQKKK